MKIKSAGLLVTLVALVTTCAFGVQDVASARATAKPTVLAHATTSTAVSTRHTSLGKVLVGPTGRTLYLWEADYPKTSTCFGACAKVWPPLMLVGKLKAAGGVKFSLLGSIARKGGGRQVTYRGHPLYYYTGDPKPGGVSGEASDSFGSHWLALSVAGNGITDD